MVEASSPQVDIGMLVMTADGHQLGRVKATSNTCIGLDILLGPDYWIGRDLIRDTSAGVVLLNEPKDFFNQRPTRGHGSHTGMHADEEGRES
jgi:hypothetical protein